ncbi:MAG: cob(I)yrinic acid a,c-diamide adenosyltransferase [Halodesulfurarchaeum sp.]
MPPSESEGPESAGGSALEAESIEPAAPEEFGMVQVWWGDGKGKTTAAMGMGLRAAGHGYRVHLLQFMKGGTQSVEDARGEYNAIAALPGFSYENLGHYGWHRGGLGPEDDEHRAKARAGLERARALLDAASAADLSSPFELDSDPEAGVHMLILDEIIYAANRALVDPEAVTDLIDSKPEDLELILTGGHESPDYLAAQADLITNVSLVKHPFEEGTAGRKGTEF